MEKYEVSIGREKDINIRNIKSSLYLISELFYYGFNRNRNIKQHLLYITKVVLCRLGY